jgi:hypothetical protein
LLIPFGVERAVEAEAFERLAEGEAAAGGA